MASHTTETRLFTSGETVSAYLGADTSLAAATTAVAAGDGSVTFTGLSDDRSYLLVGGTSLVRILIYTDVVAPVLVNAHAAPADAAIAAGEAYLWFDQTNGASKLMVKAKQADGTVKTASVALS